MWHTPIDMLDLVLAGRSMHSTKLVHSTVWSIGVYWWSEQREQREQQQYQTYDQR
jgi:hypothetical protein